MAANVNWGRRWRNFTLFVIWQMVLPFAPLWAELWSQGLISDRTWFIFVSIYAITLGSQSNYRPMFSAFFLVGFIYTFLYGWSFTQPDLATSSSAKGDWAAAAALLLFVFHLGERIIRHLARDEPFMEFS